MIAGSPGGSPRADDADAGPDARERSEIEWTRRAYVDADDARTTASVSASVVYAPQGRQVVIRLAAVGPPVEPAPGFEGMLGWNRLSAEALERLADEGAFMRVDRGNGSELVRCESSHARTSRMPCRRLRSDGTIDFLARTAKSHLVELSVVSPPLPASVRSVELIVQGEPRLRVELEGAESATHEVGAVAAIEAVARAGARAVAAGADDAVPPPMAIAAPPRPPVDPPAALPGDWRERDAEGRWVAWSKAIAADPASAQSWVDWLAQEREFQLIEWMCLSDPNGMFTWHGLDRLVESNAPGALRVLDWAGRTHRTSHGSPASPRHRVSKGVLLDWYERHAARFPHVVPLRDHLRAAGVERESSEGFLAPYEPAQVWPALPAQGELPEFGERLRAEPGQKYEHEIIRSIDAYALAADVAPEGIVSLERATRHTKPRVRLAALLAFTRVPPELIPRTVGLAALENPTESEEVRRAGLLANSYRPGADADSMLIGIVKQAKHPVFIAAASRLGDRPSPAGRRVLSEVKSELEPDSPELRVVEQSLERIDAFRRGSSCADGATLRRLCDLVAILERSRGRLGRTASDDFVKWLASCESREDVEQALGEIAAEAPRDDETDEQRLSRVARMGVAARMLVAPPPKLP